MNKKVAYYGSAAVLILAVSATVALVLMANHKKNTNTTTSPAMQKDTPKNPEIITISSSKVGPPEQDSQAIVLGKPLGSFTDTTGLLQRTFTLAPNLIVDATRYDAEKDIFIIEAHFLGNGCMVTQAQKEYVQYGFSESIGSDTSVVQVYARYTNEKC